MKRGKCKTRKNKISNFKLWFFVLSFQILIILGFCGCSTIASPYFVSKQKEPTYDPNLFNTYNKIILTQSGALNVIPVIHKFESELLSQSRSVVASSGQGKEGYKTWFNMAAFDEQKLTAKRKYFFLVDEKVRRVPGKRFLGEPKQGLMFDSQMVLETEPLNKVYESDNSRQIAILKQVLKNLRRDIDELGEGIDELGEGIDELNSDNKNLAISGLIINQVFGTVFYTLDNSPAQASMLSEENGVEFSQSSFGSGKIQMLAEKDTVAVKIRLGAFINMP
jgi:hypothetical protein